MTARQHGMALIEALIASAVLGIGLLGATQWTLKTLQTATDNRQYGLAQQLAREAMDCLLADDASCAQVNTVDMQGMRYTRQTRLSPRTDGLLWDVQVSVAWASAASEQSHTASRRIDWHTSVAQVPGWVSVSSP
jgi:prepilin-type N-terminal cleavage/methylation domain-containing protein